MADPRFDFKVLSEVTGDDPAFERELLEEFLHATRDLLERQRGAAEAGDVGTLEKAAHSMKGSSRTLGAEGLGRYASEIESFAHNRDLAHAVASLQHAVDEFAKLQPVLEQHMKRLAA